MTHPYEHMPDYRRWRTAVAGAPPSDVDPMVTSPFQLSTKDRIVTAGSCFAQHIGRHLRGRNFCFHETEPAHPILSADLAARFGYGMYSARYGNIYTSRQLLQLLRRAYGRFVPGEDIWQQDGRFIDPFRPTIQPNGFASVEEFYADREQHFRAVRLAFETLDCLVFTLGLTEGWESTLDGAAFPLCPGTVGGSFDSTRHRYASLGVEAVVDDMRHFIAELRQINPRAKVIISVSPVPLAATAENRHVLISTTYSKAVLRVAAETLSHIPDVEYFPAYEIVTGAFSRGQYFAEDLRSIREEGVQHVMDVFFRHFTTQEYAATARAQPTQDDFLPRMRHAMDTLCDEERLDPGA